MDSSKSINHKYHNHLSQDLKFQPLIQQLPAVTLEKRNKIYLRICASILSQQLSVKVAKVLYERFLGLYDGREPTVQQILATPAADLRQLGFSNAKSNYVHNVCRFFIEQKLTDRQIHQMENEQVIALLTQIKGVGRWTVEMLLMFTLAREDVFAPDDLGIRHAMIKLYGIRTKDKKKINERLLRISKKWAPYRTYACRYLWTWKDGKGEW